MSEVIRVPRDRTRVEHIAGTPAEPEPERPQTTEVIRVGNRRANSDSVSVEHSEADPEQPQRKEVIRVGTPARQESAEKPVPADPETPRATEVRVAAGGPASREAIGGKAEHQLREVAAIAVLFSDSLKALDLVAAEQARWVLNIAE